MAILVLTVQGSVKQNHGVITVESDAGRGATFLIYLPIAVTVEPSGGPLVRAAGAAAVNPLAVQQLFHEASLIVRSFAQEAVDGLDKQAPLWARFDHAQRVEGGLHLGGDANAELRIVLDPLAFARAGRRTSDARL